jgi:hypothetical protein
MNNLLLLKATTLAVCGRMGRATAGGERSHLQLAHAGDQFSVFAAQCSDLVQHLAESLQCPRVACFRIVGGFLPLHGGLVGQDGERSVAHGQPLGGLFGLLDGPLIKDAGAVSQSTRARTGFLDPRLLAWSSPLGGNLWGVINGIPLCGQGPRGGIQRGDAVIGRASGPGG